MDEEEQKRQAASAAFAQADKINASTRNDPYSLPRREMSFEEEVVADERAVSPADRSVAIAGIETTPIMESDVADHFNGYRPVKATPFATQWDRDRGFGTVPGASEAFAQLDQAQPSNPTQFDAASVAGLEPAQQQMVRENFDANLEAATRAVEEYAQGDDAFSRQAQRLLDRAERARGRQAEAAMPIAPKVQPPVSTPAKPEFTPLVTPSDWQTSANMKLTEQYGEDPFAF